jgi:aryl-alcohol dehydrogenase-like predicted oxidoreductase
MDLTAKIGLGTVQWGMAYGIANRAGPPDAAEVGRLLGIAARAGIALLDTAHAYGEAEAVIGRAVAADAPFRVVTKTLPVAAATISPDDLARVRAAFGQSLARLNRPRIYGVLVHAADNLLAPGGERIWDWLEELRRQGTVERIGVSLYEPDQFFRLRERFGLTLVQIPLNVYDRRFIASGALREMAAAGIEVHARSAFLQGLLLLAPDALPPAFAALRGHHARFRQWSAAAGLGPLAACLAFVLAQPHVARVIVGCERAAQLDEIVAAARLARPGLAVPDDLALTDETVLNPSRWPKP